jgi:hypothetical protein
MNTESTVFLEKISELQNEYYSNNTKNLLFKTKQKQDFANKITNKMGLDEMISNTIYLIPNTNKIYFDYTIFKLYASPENYDYIMSYIVSLFNKNIEKYGKYEPHINLNTFSISALERYRPIIIKFCNDFLKTNKLYTDTLQTLYIYNSPSMIQLLINVMSPYVDGNVLNKMFLINKKDSEKLISELLNNNNTIETI